MKLLTAAALLFTLSGAVVRAQNAAVVSPPLNGPVGGYLVLFPQAPVVTIRFDGNSEDIAKVLAPHPSTSFNHDGAAFNNYVRSVSSASFNDNLVNYVQSDKNRAEYKKNVKSGKWHPFVNGE